MRTNYNFCNISALLCWLLLTFSSHILADHTFFFFWSATIVYLNFYEEKMSKLKKKKKKRKRDEYKLQTKLMYFTIYIQFFFIKKIDSILLQDMGWE